MAGRNLSIFKGILAVAVLAVVIYVTVFFCFPATSAKYFSTAFDSSAVTLYMAEGVFTPSFLSRDERRAVVRYFSTENGKELAEAVIKAAGKGKEEVEKVLSSPLADDMRRTLSSSISPEKAEKLFSSAADAVTEAVSGAGGK